MRIGLLADIHLADSIAEAHGVDTYENFRIALAELLKFSPDHIVLLGDYSLRKPKEKDAQFVCDTISKTGIPFSLIAGNHDNPATIRQLLTTYKIAAGDVSYYKKMIGNIPALFLDSSQKEIDSTQLEWFQNEIQRLERNAFVFIHHPPYYSGVPFMENGKQLKDKNNALKNILASSPYPLSIHCGHYHNARTVQIDRGNHLQLINPATYYQIESKTEEFAVAHTMPGYRTIEVTEYGMIHEVAIVPLVKPVMT